MTLPLIPQPRTLELLGGDLQVGRLVVDVWPDELTGLRAGAERCLAPIGDQGIGTTPVRVTADAALPAEGYRLSVAPDGIAVSGPRPPRGVARLAHPARSLAPRSARPAARSHRGLADLRCRGVFVDSTWSSDQMSLDDWRDLVDRLAQLKLNRLGIAVYGCWDMRHDAEPSEFLFVPLRDFPELVTTNRVRTWDPVSEREVVRLHTPRMFADDLLRTVIEYGRSSGVEVIPVLGGPGHSSYLPRALPAISALDDDGEPTHYGYCVGRDEPRAVLRRLVTNLVEQHLVPAGATTLGCSGDEYYPIRNLLADDPLREISPWCRCHVCRELSPGELLLRYLDLLEEVALEHGLRTLCWHDSLVREGVLERYADARLARTPRPIVGFWCYGDPLPALPDVPVERWVTPSTGLSANLFASDLSPNIDGWLREGMRAGATGAIAYNGPDPASHQNYACLADLSWNFEGSGGAAGFKRRFAELVAPAAADDARAAFALGETVLASYGFLTHILDHLLPYFSTAPHGVTRFPDDIALALTAPSPAFASAIRQAAATLRSSARQLPATRPVPGWPEPGETWRAEIERIAGQAELMLGLVSLVHRLSDESLDELESEIAALELQGIELMRRVAGHKVAYLQDAVLREHWYLAGDLRACLERLASQPDRLPRHEHWHAWLF